MEITPLIVFCSFNSILTQASPIDISILEHTVYFDHLLMWVSLVFSLVLWHWILLPHHKVIGLHNYWLSSLQTFIVLTYSCPLSKNGWVSRCQQNSYSSSPEWLEKAGRTSSHLLVGHYEERPIIPQPQCGRCHRAGTGQATLEIIGSKQSYALIWCKPNNNDDDDSYPRKSSINRLIVEMTERISKYNTME